MTRDVAKLLAVLLAMVLGLSPAASGWAGTSHSCTPIPEGPAAESGHSGHGARHGGAALEQPRGLVQNDGCADCPPECCTTGPCASHACGHTVAALPHGTGTKTGFAATTTAGRDPGATPDLHPASIFRPPRG